MREHLDEVVRSTVEETLNALLDEDADHLCGARKYECTEGRKDMRAGSYDRHLQTKAGEVTLTIPKLRNLDDSAKQIILESHAAGTSPGHPSSSAPTTESSPIG
jgi:hypothetical protein